MGNLSLARLVSGERTHAVFSPSISHLTPRPLSTVSRKPGLHPLDIEDGIYEFDDLQCCLLLFAQFAHEFLLPEGIASRS